MFAGYTEYCDLTAKEMLEVRNPRAANIVSHQINIDIKNTHAQVPTLLPSLLNTPTTRWTYAELLLRTR